MFAPPDAVIIASLGLDISILIMRNLLIAILAAPLFAWAQPALVEFACVYTREDTNGLFFLESAENLEVLTAVQDAGTFSLPTNAPPSVVAVNCALRTRTGVSRSCCRRRGSYPLYHDAASECTAAGIAFAERRLVCW
jgi:hypothetical protein